MSRIPVAVVWDILWVPIIWNLPDIISGADKELSPEQLTIPLPGTLQLAGTVICIGPNKRMQPNDGTARLIPGGRRR